MQRTDDVIKSRKFVKRCSLYLKIMTSNLHDDDDDDDDEDDDDVDDVDDDDDDDDDTCCL